MWVATRRSHSCHFSLSPNFVDLCFFPTMSPSGEERCVTRQVTAAWETTRWENNVDKSGCPDPTIRMFIFAMIAGFHCDFHCGFHNMGFKNCHVNFKRVFSLTYIFHYTPSDWPLPGRDFRCRLSKLLSL